jgi:hypothetical protein
MAISADGKSLNFRNIGTGAGLKVLNGTRANKLEEQGYGIGDTP